MSRSGSQKTRKKISKKESSEIKKANSNYKRAAKELASGKPLTKT